MNTEQLREDMAKALREHYLSDCPGMPSWKDCEIKDHWRAKADGAVKACQKAGLVFVVEDAELPKFTFSEEPPNMRFGYQEAQQDMLKAGYRQTKEIEVI